MMNPKERSTANGVVDHLFETINTYEHGKTTQAKNLILDAAALEPTVSENFESFWIDLFISEFLSEDVQHDDLLFFVRHLESIQLVANSRRTSFKHGHHYNYKMDRSLLDEQPEQIELYRKDSKRMPIGDQDIDWRRTVYLNYILQNFTYTITCAICKIDKDQIQVTRKHSVEVYASPSARHMSLNKAKDERITYPDIHFAVDRYEEFLNEISVSDGHIICIELIATNKKNQVNTSLFLGSITHSTMSNSIKSGRFMAGCSLLQSQADMGEIEFILVRGPGSFGKAEIALMESRQKKLVHQPTSMRRSAESDNYELIDLDPDEIKVTPESNKLKPLSNSIHFLCFPMMKKAQRALKHRRSMSEGNLVADSEMQLQNCDHISRREELNLDRKPLTRDGQHDSSKDEISMDSSNKNKFMALANLRNALDFCRPKTKQFASNPMIINAYITNINMKWSHIIDELKVFRAPIFGQ